MKLNDIESKRLLPAFSREQADWICNALDVFVKAVDDRLSVLSSPFTLEAIHALTDEELQLWFEQFKLAKYYPDLPREYRDRILYDEIRLFNMLGTKPAVEALCKYIFADFETTVSIIDNLAFDDTGTLVDASAKDLYDAIVNIPDSSFGNDETQIRRIFENLKKFGRASQKLRKLILETDSDVEMSLLAVDSHISTGVCDDSDVGKEIDVHAIYTNSLTCYTHKYDYVLNKYIVRQGAQTVAYSESAFYMQDEYLGIIRGFERIYIKTIDYAIAFSGNITDQSTVQIKNVRDLLSYGLKDAKAVVDYTKTFPDKILRYNNDGMVYTNKSGIDIMNTGLTTGEWKISESNIRVDDDVVDAYCDTRYARSAVRVTAYAWHESKWLTLSKLHENLCTLYQMTQVDIWNASTAHKCSLAYQASQQEPGIPGYYFVLDDGSGSPVEQWFSRQELEAAGYQLTPIYAIFSRSAAYQSADSTVASGATLNVYSEGGTETLDGDQTKDYVIVDFRKSDGTSAVTDDLSVMNVCLFCNSDGKVYIHNGDYSNKTWNKIICEIRDIFVFWALTDHTNVTMSPGSSRMLWNSNGVSDFSSMPNLVNGTITVTGLYNANGERVLSNNVNVYYYSQNNGILIDAFDTITFARVEFTITLS